jgi:hypothetical protein
MLHLIGTRWSPRRKERRDDESGLYESVNPVMGPEDVQVQRALLTKPAPRRVSWVFWWALLLGAALFVAWSLKP